MTTLEHIEQALVQQVRSWERVVKRQKMLKLSVLGLQFSLALSIVIYLITRTAFNLSVLYFIIFILLLVLLSTVLIIGWVQVKRPVMSLVAQHFDAVFDLQERTSTALELLSGKLQATPDLKALQVRDAYQQIQRVDLKKQVYPAPNRYDGWRIMGLVVILSVLLFVFPPTNNPQALSQSEPEAHITILEGENKVEGIIKEIALDANMDDETRQALLEQLSTILEPLSHEAITLDEAIALIEEARNALETQASTIRAELDEQRQALDNALQTLQDETGTFETLEDALQSLNEPSNPVFDEQSPPITPDQLQQAAEQLAEQAPELAEQMQQLAEQLTQDNPENMQQMLEQSVTTLQEIEQAQNQQQQIADQLDELAQELEEKTAENDSESADDSEGIESTDQTGGEEPQSEQDGDTPSDEGEQDGEETTGGDEPSNEDGSTSETNDQQGQNSQSSNQDGDSNNQQTGESNNPQQTGEFDSLDQLSTPDQAGAMPSVSVPQSILDQSEAEIRLEADETVIQQGDFVDNPTGTISIPYNEVFNIYQNNASSALEQRYIPLGLRDVVRDYFSAITPDDNR